MALNWTAIDTAIKTWLDTYAPTVTWARGDQDLPVLAHPWGVWRWRSGGGKRANQGNLPDEHHQSSTTENQIFKWRVHQLEVNIYSTQTVGTTALTLATQVRDSLELEQVRIDLETAGLVLTAQGSPRDLTALFQDQYESRAIVEIMAQTVDTATETVGSIATADITPSLAT